MMAATPDDLAQVTLIPAPDYETTANIVRAVKTAPRFAWR